MPDKAIVNAIRVRDSEDGGFEMNIGALSMQQNRLLTTFTMFMIIPRNLNTLDNRYGNFGAQGYRNLMRLRGGKLDIDGDDQDDKRKTKKSLRAGKISKSERRQIKRERRKDRLAMVAAQNLAAKHEASLLAMKERERTAPSLDRSETVIFEKGRGSKMTPRRQRDDDGDSTLEWDEEQAVAEKIGDGVTDWRLLQAAVKRREPTVRSDSGNQGDSNDGLAVKVVLKL